MAGYKDPREEEVEPREPDFSLPEAADETDAPYMMILMGLLEAFYDEYKDASPEYILETIDKRSEQLLDDIHSIIDLHLPMVGEIGAEDALESIEATLDSVLTDEQRDAVDFTAMYFTALEALKAGAREQAEVDLSYAITEQKMTTQGIVDEVRNDLKASALYIQNRQAQEPGSQVKTGNILRRATFRSKVMATYGARTAYNTVKKKYYETIYTDDTLYDWITARDGRVCKFCAYFELNGPYPLYLLPPCPYHPACRCTFEPSAVSFRKGFLDIIRGIFE